MYEVICQGLSFKTNKLNDHYCYGFSKIFVSLSLWLSNFNKVVDKIILTVK